MLDPVKHSSGFGDGDPLVRSGGKALASVLEAKSPEAEAEW